MYPYEYVVATTLVGSGVVPPSRPDNDWNFSKK